MPDATQLPNPLAPSYDVKNPEESSFGAWIKHNLFGGSYDLALEEQTRQYNRALELERWNRENEYNSPIQQMARLREAGLNPHLAYGSASASNSGNAQMSAANAPAIAQHKIDPLGFLGRVGQVMEQFIRVKNGEQMIERNSNDLKYQDVINSLRSRQLALQNFNHEQRNQYMRTMNLWLPQLMDDRSSLINQQISKGKYDLVNLEIGLADAVRDAISFGYSEESIKDAIKVYLDTNPDRFFKGKHLEMAARQYGVDISALDSEQSENRLSKALSDAGLGEGDPLAARLMAFLGVGAKGQSAAAITNDILSLIRGAQQMQGQHQSNKYMRRQARYMSMPHNASVIDMETGGYLW